jgi:carbonic anhydrase
MNPTLSVEQQGLIHDNIELLSSCRTEDFHRVNESEWNYVDSGNDWYQICTQGTMQSPILIDNTNIIKLGVIGGSYYPFTYNYPPTQSVGEFIDKTYRISYPDGCAEFLTMDGNLKKFNTVKIEIHAPAEHIIKGKQKALELHVVHKEYDTGNFMILAVLFKLSANHNNFVQDLIDNQSIDIARLIGERPEIYVYCGSLTCPPCTEIVLWAVSANTQKLSYEQVKFFSSKWENNQAFAVGHGNNRSTQILNNRVVFNFN